MKPTVAIIDWCHIIEDFIDNLGVSFDEFRTEFRGSWIFGYMEALERQGVRAIWFCVSQRVTAPWRFVHAPTGCSVCVLPAPWLYRAIRRRLPNPYAETVEGAVGEVHGPRRLFFSALKDIAPYVSTPLRQLAREVRREHCVAILCQEYENPRFDVCVLLGRLLKVPVFATFQGGQWQHSRIERLFRAAALESCAGLIVAPQRESQRLMTQYDLKSSAITQIFNPIDVRIWQGIDHNQARAELGIPNGARVVIWHGRVMLDRKGLDVLLDAWDRVCRERPSHDLRLILLGTGADSNELRRRINTRRLRGVTWEDRFISDVSQLRRYLAASDVYAFPSRHEGFPVAPLEAMSAGLPVVAATAPGIPDIFEAGEASGGLLVPVGDSRAFADALGRLIDDTEGCRELGRRAKRRAEEGFSLETVGARLSTRLTQRCA